MSWYVRFRFNVDDNRMEFFHVTDKNIIYIGENPLGSDKDRYEDRWFVDKEFFVPISEEEKDIFLARAFDCEENIEWIRKNYPETLL